MLYDEPGVDRKSKVLVVDDEPAVRRFVSIGLTLAGYDVITTGSGEEALELARAEKPDIMLLDIVMVPMSGLEVLGRLRRFSRMPVIVFSANHLAAAQAMELGATGTMAKPFLPADLTGKVKATLEKSQAGPAGS
jgi:DNA-binding response OmpR family regulator